MITVKLTYPDWPIQRQSPGQKCIWNNCRYSCNSKTETCDYWVVFEGLGKKNEIAICPKDNTVLITAEPPTLKTYKKEFIDQFATVITCHSNLEHRNSIIQHSGMPWHVGRRQKGHHNISFSKDYDELKAIKNIEKTRLISVISSAKDFSGGHRKRLDFAKMLKNHFGESIDLFGRGINEVEDKWDALAAYKYHVAIENSGIDDYWTEKLSDAFLAGCYPIYYGCTNIDRYFDPGSMTTIDIDYPDNAIDIIEECIKNNRHDQAKRQIWQSREKVLDEYNLFALIAEFIEKDKVNKVNVKSQYEKIKLKKEPSESNLIYQLRKKLRQLFNHSIS